MFQLLEAGGDGLEEILRSIKILQFGHLPNVLGYGGDSIPGEVEVLHHFEGADV